MREDDRATEPSGEERGPLLRPVAPPELSLPRGGGALRAIGESFTAGGPTGTGALRVPLAVSPGRAGFGPDLALQYDSGSGQGPFGIGWGLSTPQITRRTDRGLPRYVDADESDVFVLTGAEDLVPVLALRDGCWVRDGLDEGDVRVDFYRPRVEQGFARIERRTDRRTGIAHWRTITPDNVTSVFGLTERGRIADPSDPRKVFSWLLEATYDDRGQAAVYEYKAEDLAGVERDGVEVARHAAAPTNRYCKRVRYANREPLARRHPDAAELFGRGYLFEAVFDYGEHTEDTPDERAPWSVRPDPISTRRAGFEIRTYRLCRRLLMFHRMPEELGAPATLVRATELTYEASPIVTYLRRVVQVGYRDTGGGRVRAAAPPLGLDYSRAELDGTVREVSGESLAGMPAGLDGRRYQLVDLDGEGLPGILVLPDGPGRALYYKRNLGGGVFGPLEELPTLPSTLSSSSRLLSLDADGRLDVVNFDGPAPGFYERAENGDWLPFQPFASLPNVDYRDPRLRFVDLDGDGLPDLLIGEDDILVWYSSRARDGFGPPLRAPRPGGVSLADDDSREGIFLADMSGDGLGDIVRIRNGEISYWPNLGYGRFGAKITMRGAPIFDEPDHFDARRIRLGDIDGSGTSDCVYLSGRGATIYANQSGNGWSAGRTLSFPLPHTLADVQLVDLLGTGTLCLVWSSSAPREASSPLRYMDLQHGTKPHLLVRSENGLGAETRVRYAPSTRFYLEDRAAARPWLTRLPFPVHLVARVAVIDHVQRTRYTSAYRYAHGFFDGAEREFRGFARVEQLDTERIPAQPGAPGADDEPGAYLEVDAELRLPPIRTVTWYHTGASRTERDALEPALRREFFSDGQDPLPVTRLPADLDGDELHEAFRALRGHPLRQEVYAEDGTALAGVPYLVESRTYEVRRLQPIADQRHGVFHAFERELVGAHHERATGDPRVEHQLTLEVDALGHVRRSAHVAYPRRCPGEPEQHRMLVTATRIDLAPPIATRDDHRHGVVTASRRYELPLPPAGERLALEAVDAAMQAAAEVPFDATPSVGQKRAFEHVRHRYYKDDLSGPLPFGAVEPRALVFESYALALTEALASATFGSRRAAGALVDDGGHVFMDGAYWSATGVRTYAAAQFYQPTRFTDVFGNTAIVRYDAYRLFVVEEHTSTDPHFDNVTTARIDYRALSPWLTTDPNGNRNAVAFDALGMVVATAVMGRAGAHEGDTLADPTTRLEYDVLRWQRERRPAFVHTFTRERHGAANRRFVEAYSYSDGSGHEVLKKAQAEPGPDRIPRWIGTGRTVYDNKGNPVKRYEPYFSPTFEYEDEPAIVMTGHTAVYRYDPLGRLVRTDFPDGTFATAAFDAWSETRADVNDNVLESRWYAERIALPAGHPDRRAAVLAAAHAHTPAVHVVDPLGRTFLSIADNGPEGRYETRLTLDIVGAHVAVTDARGNVVLRQTYDAVGNVVRAEGSDAGVSRNAYDVTGRPLRSWDSRGYAHRRRYDPLRRLTHLYVAPPSCGEYVAERLVYGEGLPRPNFRGRVYAHFDGAGAGINEQYDFEGRITRTSRRLARAYREAPRWDVLDGPLPPAELLEAAAPLLEPDAFVTRTDYDAMGRVERVVTPDETAARFSYNEAALLERVDVHLRGCAAPTPFVSDIDYNARGQRTQIAYGAPGGGVTTSYTYDDRTTMLVRVRTTRDLDRAALQDLTYTLDPAHNIVQVADAAQARVFFAGDVVDGTQRFEYDALYQLKRAEGREHPGQVGYAEGPNGYPEAPVAPLPHRQDLQALLRYVERYTYDPVGNILEVRHAAPARASNWTRSYAYEAGSNRLAWTSLPGDLPSDPRVRRYHYDARGNTVAMPHLASLGWDHDDRLHAVDLGGGGRAYYAYDGQGQRVRKVVERGGKILERVYVGNFERYRERTGASEVTFERETVHVFDGHRRLALVETTTTDPAAPGEPRIRVQLANHLGTATVETDLRGTPISYEELYPFGGSSFRAGDPERRYRYTGKERDEETGFYYHGARYYAPWLGRWISPDPAGLVDGTDVYAYVENNPIKFSDPTGLWEWPSWRTVAIVAAVAVVATVVTVATAGAAAPLVGAAVASAGLTGTAATVATGVVVGAVAGAAGGVAGEVTRTGLGEGRLPTGRELARAAAMGAALGAVTGGAGAFASTVRGAQTISATVRTASRIPGAATAGQIAGAVARGAQAVARAPGVAQVVRATAAVARATGRGLGAIERAAGGAGLRAARGVFTGSEATRFLEGYAATRSVAAGFGVARPSAAPLAAAEGGAAAEATGGAAPPAPAPAPAPPPAGAAAPPPAPAPAAAAPAAAAPLTRAQIGRLGEQEARSFLASQGFTNIRSIQNASGHGIDLIAEDAAGQTFFFEVKASAGGTAGSLRGAQRSITSFVTSRIQRAALGTGQWASAPPAVQAEARRLLAAISDPFSPLPIQGQVISVTNVGSPSGVTITTRTW